MKGGDCGALSLLQVSDADLINITMSLVAKFLIGGEYYVEVASNLSEKLCIALQLRDIDDVFIFLKEIKVNYCLANGYAITRVGVYRLNSSHDIIIVMQGEVFSPLKRLWSKFQKHLHAHYLKCIIIIPNGFT